MARESLKIQQMRQKLFSQHAAFKNTHILFREIDSWALMSLNGFSLRPAAEGICLKNYLTLTPSLKSSSSTLLHCGLIRAARKLVFCTSHLRARGQITNIKWVFTTTRVGKRVSGSRPSDLFSHLSRAIAPQLAPYSY